MNYLRYSRQKRGLSQDRLAELSGIAQAVISKIENGKRAPLPATLEKLARPLGVKHPSWLVMPVHQRGTFGELIEGKPEKRRDYMFFMQATGRLPYFVKRLEDIYRASEDDNADVRARIQASYVLGYAQAVRDEEEEAEAKAVPRKEKVKSY